MSVVHYWVELLAFAVMNKKGAEVKRPILSGIGISI
jgi:hypothetical protein